MTPGEKHTETTAKAALKLLGDDERLAVEAWIDDRERTARSTAATTALQREAAETFGVIGALVLVGGAVIASLLYLAGVFEPSPEGCPVCPAPKVCPVCATPTALEWQEVIPRYSGAPITQTRYAVTGKQECVSLGDTILCAPLRTPAALPPQVSP